MSSISSPRLVFFTTMHSGWGRAHMQRVVSWLQDFPGAEVVDIVLENRYEPNPGLLAGDDPEASELISPVNLIRIRSRKELLEWLRGRRIDLAVVDRREPPPVLIDALVPTPIIAFDLRSRLDKDKKNNLRDQYRRSLEKITYAVNPIPSLEKPWGNLNGLDYLVFPMGGNTLRKKSPLPASPSSPYKGKEKKGFLYLGEFTDLGYLDQSLRGIAEIIGSGNLRSLRGYPAAPLPLVIIVSERSRARLETWYREKKSDSALASLKCSFQAFNQRGVDWGQVGVLFTHYGLMGFEGIHQGIPTYFLEPTEYHRELALRYFPELLLSQACRTIQTGKNTSLQRNIPLVKARLGKIGRGRGRLQGIFKALADRGRGRGESTGMDKACDLCGGELRVKHRRSWMNLSRCSDCGSYAQVMMAAPDMQNRKKNGSRDAGEHRQKKLLWLAPEEDYGPEYFMHEYEKSYGRSYQEDEAAIKGLARPRMKTLMRLWKKESPRLLDIGCAYGFFLDVAREWGCHTHGVDISSHARKNIRAHRFVLGDFRDDRVIAALTQSSPAQEPEGGFDLITLWYVIEHFPDIHPVVRRLASLQKPGGILGLSTPNARGLSARWLSEKFLNTSPSDHYYIFSILGLKKIFSDYGYEYVGFRSGGIHFERLKEACPRMAKVIPQSLYRIWGIWAAYANWGDTMEVYFRKRASVGIHNKITP